MNLEYNNNINYAMQIMRNTWMTWQLQSRFCNESKVHHDNNNLLE